MNLKRFLGYAARKSSISRMKTQICTALQPAFGLSKQTFLMRHRHITQAAFAAMIFGLMTGTHAIAAPVITVYGTTAASNAGSSFTPATIVSGSTVRFDDGATVSGTNAIAINGELQFNQSTGTLTLSNVVSGNGTLTLSNSGTLQLTGTTAGTRLIPLNMTINTSSGRLMGPQVSGTETGIFQLGASGTGTLNVSGGFVSGSAWQIGLGSTGVGTVNVTGGTFGPFGALTVGGSSGGSGGTGTLTINGGVVGDNPTTPLNNEGFRFGVGQNSSGVATITSGTLGASATGNGGSFIGLAGTGSVGLNSGYLQAGHLTLGAASTGRGSLTIASGSASVNNLTIGGTGSGTLTITGGVMKSGGGFLGSATSGTGTVTVSSGTWLVNGNGLSNGERDGVLRVGGTSGGTGNLTIGNGGYVVVSGSFIRGANGTFSLNEGGTLQIGGQSGVYTPSTATGTASAVGSGTMGVLVGDLNYAGTLKFAQNNNSGTLTSSTYSGNLSGTGDLVKTGTGTLIIGGSNSYTGGTKLDGGTLSLNSANAIGTTGNITFNGGALQATANNTQDYSSRFSTAADQQYRIDSNGQSVTISANLTSANGSFTKLGSGNITLTGSNTFTSGSAAAGVLQGSATNLATSGSFGVASGAEVRFNQTAPNQTWAGAMAGSGTFSKYGDGTLTLTGSTSGTTGTLLIAEGAVKGTTNNIRRDVVNNSQLTFDQTTSGTYSRSISGTGNVLLSNSGTITWTGTNTYTGTTTVAGGRLIGNTNNIVGNVVNNSAVQFNQTVSGTYAGNMSGSGPLAKNNNGALTLTGSNSYQGGTFVNAGSLIGDTGSLQGSIAVGSGTLGFDQATSGTFSGLLLGTSPSSRFVKAGVGDLTLSGTNTNDGAWTVSGGWLIGTTNSVSGNITNNSAVTFDQSTSGTYSQVMSGTGSLTKAGAGAVTLTGNNSYSGGTIVSAGSLIGTTSSLQGNINNYASVTFDQSTSGTYSQVMSGTGSLTKSGNGALIISGSNTYSGATVVDSGELNVNGSIASSAVKVNSEGSLSGSGTVGGISGAGSINPGNSPGILTAPWIDPSDGMFLNFEITGIKPEYSLASGSVNDVLRLTSASPFVAAMNSGNQINVYFNMASFDMTQAYLGGIYTDQQADFASMVSGANFNYYVQDNAG
ncbi:MAG: autotransporter-associated beta strand repeat-containing protein, partial [Verrucomicrobia bacterium]|nr:autotransporter-associated beta strand repeat-containing protein [Verrucomicrobiota bacterium]